jgi:hypothetical protein
MAPFAAMLNQASDDVEEMLAVVCDMLQRLEI